MRWFWPYLILALFVLSAFHAPEESNFSIEDKKQEIAERVKRVQHIADSIVISFYGDVNFQMYVRLDTNHPCCITDRGWGSPEPLANRAQFTVFPKRYNFKYTVVGHPYFKNEKEGIRFRLDSVGGIVWEWYSRGSSYFAFCSGLHKNPDFDHMIDSTTAIAVAKQHGMKKPVARKSRIAWCGDNHVKDTDSTKTFSDVRWGVWAWEIASMEGEAQSVGCIMASGLRHWYINAFTGEFVRTEDD